ncbi:hypothetical protein [Tunturiibacter gelidoferens]|uniref:Uncharacterized protein n=1 Tax=Tunturiibacter gelidiferens TaxID=3069689 RepID=A0A9X0U5R5_9BACT|nr:hypothetical protein [Edaphobacter lichenicola]MBB5330713.1 hypothetical protein [Edaphobacter lichenicola]
MTPGELRAESFTLYPPQARSFAIRNPQVLQRMPLILVSVILRQLIQFPWCFPAERERLSRQFDLMSKMDNASFDGLMSAFSTITLSSELRDMEWVDHPQLFREHLTAYLWSEHQIDRYHKAAQGYQQFVETALKKTAPASPRWTIVTIGQGSEQSDRQLFRKLQPHGTLFTQLDPTGGLEILLAEVRSRAQRYPIEYGLWYIEGGALHAASVGATYPDRDVLRTTCACSKTRVLAFESARLWTKPQWA